MSLETAFFDAVTAEVRSTIDDMLDNPDSYFSLEGMEHEASEIDADELRIYVALKLQNS